ncbi:MAG: SDR family NAD(P)-dependent oxidoreductase [Chloroflexota bacterium]
MKNNKVLVTGGTGFVGTYLVKRLAGIGYSVCVLARTLDTASHLQNLPNVVILQGDIRDSAAVENALKDIDTVYHLAASFRSETISDYDLNQINVTGTENMLKAAAQAEVKRFVHVSTVGVHGVPDQQPGDESFPYQADNRVAISKTEGEKIAIKYMQDSDLSITIVRTGPGVYGPGDMRYLKLFKGINKGRFIVFGSGEINYQIIFVEDLVDGLILAATKEEAIGEIFIMTGNHAITLNELVAKVANTLGVNGPKFRLPVMPVYYAGYLCEIVCKPFGISPPLYRRRVDFFRNSRSFSIKKANQVLGFQPKVSYEEGLARTADWYKQMGYL